MRGLLVMGVVVVLVGCGKPPSSGAANLGINSSIVQCTRVVSGGPFAAGTVMQYLSDTWSNGHSSSTCQLYSSIGAPVAAGDSSDSATCSLIGPGNYTVTFVGSTATIAAPGQPYDGSIYRFAASDCQETKSP